MNSSAFVFNPLFDTVIQRNNYNYLRYHNRELDDKTIDKLFVRCYTGILRWQMLTVGSVVLTDAMWYDSIFFRKLVEADNAESFEEAGKSSFKALCRFVEYNVQKSDNRQKISPLMVRVRPRHISNMFFKAFYFSSVSDYQLRDVLLKAGKKIAGITESEKALEKGAKEDSIDQAMCVYKKLLKYACKNSAGENDKIFSENSLDDGVACDLFENEGKDSDQWIEIKKFYEYIKYLGKSLFQIDRNLSYIKGNWPKGVNLTKDPLKEAFSKVKEDFEKRYCFKDKNGIHAPQNKNLKKIWEELNSDKPRRSKIESNLEEIKNDWREPVIKEFYDVFEEEYNRAIAEMQQLEYLDCRQILERELFLKKYDKSSVACSAIEFLGSMSWEEFQKLYNAAIPGRYDEVWKAQNESETYVLLGKEAGGIEIQGESLYDRIFGGRVSFMKLNGIDRMFIPEKFRKQIVCRGGNLDYNDCVLFSNRKDAIPIIKSYFHDNFDSDAAKALLCPKIISPLLGGK